MFVLHGVEKGKSVIHANLTRQHKSWQFMGHERKPEVKVSHNTTSIPSGRVLF